MARKRRRKRRHPFAYTTLLQDHYFPRSNIPRPFIKDYREHPRLFGIKKRRPRFARKRHF